MKKTLKFFPLASMLMLTSLSQVAQAEIILDATGNNTLATAQDISSSFSSTATPSGFELITNGLDWVSIGAGAGNDIDDGNGYNDYFSFSVEANAKAYFEFDNFNFANFMDPDAGPTFELFDATDSKIAFDYFGAEIEGFVFENEFGDGDSNFLSYTFATAGTYTFGTTGACDFICEGSSQGDSYTLNIAVDGLAGQSVPEPSTMAIFSLAFLGLGFRKYKSSK